MAYTIGVSSGMFSIARSQPKQAEQYLTVLRKIFWGAQRGVNFTQLDLESITEFDEPFVLESVKKVKELGLKFGIHGETAATGAHTMILESALADEYSRGHERLIAHIKGGGKLGADYVLIHAAEAMPIKLIGTQALQSNQIVDFWGREIRDFLEEFPDILDWATDEAFMQKIAFGPYNVQDEQYYIEQYRRQSQASRGGTEISADEEIKIKEMARKTYIEDKRKNVFDGTKRPSLTYGSERLAYALMAKWMETRQDPLWVNIVGKTEVFDAKMYNNFSKWVPAVTAKYIWGHFHPLKVLNGKYTVGMKAYTDPKPLLTKNNIMWVFEPEMGKTGWEKYMRLISIPHIHQLVKAIDHPNLKVAIDIEHLLSSGEDPLKNVDKLPHGAGKDVYVLHVGWPTPHKPAHVPLHLGSEAQHYVYDVLYRLRQKGWKDGIIIFERGGGDDPVKSSVVSIRQIVKYLEMDVHPKKLPEDFFGFAWNGFNVRRQRVNIQMHAYDPLAGLITQPEEEHGLLGSEAIKKGKGDQWKKAKYK